MTADREIRGPLVDYFFDNLLPDNPDIRNRIRDRFQIQSTRAFDLLEEIGRDCAGAVQLLPLDREPVGWNTINAQPMTTADVARTLREVSALRHWVAGRMKRQRTFGSRLPAPKKRPRFSRWAVRGTAHRALPLRRTS